MRLGLWLVDAVQTTLCEVLGLFLVDPHILGSLKEALNSIVSGVYLMQTQNINLCLVVERAIAAPLLKSI